MEEVVVIVNLPFSQFRSSRSGLKFARFLGPLSS